MLNKKFLLVTNIYPPAFAPRMGYMLKYLQPKGWAAEVVSRFADDDNSYESLVHHLPKQVNLNVGKITFKNRITAIIYNFCYPLFFYLDALAVYSTSIRLSRKSQFSFILCCISDNVYMLQGAHWISKRLKIPLLVDFRDIQEQNPLIKRKQSFVNSLVHITKFSYIFNKRNKLLANANFVTTVSNWHAQTLQHYNKKVSTIYNGYDEEFFKPHNSEKSDVFEITYTGTILPIRHDVELFFCILYGLKKRLPKEEFAKIKISFYTPLSYRKVIIEHPLYVGLVESLFFYDYVDTKQVAQILSKASVLLLLSNIFSAEGPKGLESTTKFFEYLSVKKPILCVRSDEAGLEEAIRKLKAGFSARNTEEGISFLLDKFNEWSRQGFTSQDSNYEVIQNYTRERQAYQFENIFLSLFSEK